MSDNMEKDKDAAMPVSKDSQINVVVNHAGEGDAIDLVRVFQNMKRGAGVFGWLTLLFVIVGMCLPLLLHGFKKPELRVASVVTLDYDVPGAKEGEMIPVANLTAPDGEDLDLSQITSSYVLSAAVAGLSLPEKVTVANIRSNIKVERILTEDSRRQQEIASKMLADKNGAAYSQLQSVKLTYVNQFVVSLDNGFGDGKNKVYLKDDELRLLLDRILESYNDYLAMTYADQKIPGDEIAVIDTDALDIMESIDLLKSAVTELYDYCDSRTDEVKDYRSARDGRSLRDLMETINTVMDVNVNYLSSYVYANSIAEDMDTMLSKYRYLLRETESKLEVANQTIATTDELIANYKPDRVLVSGQEDGLQSTSVTTDYYNELMTTQAQNYQLAAELEIEIADIKDKIANLERGNTTVKTEKAKEELKAAIETCHEVYLSVRAQMEEINGSAFYTKYADATAAQGERLSFISANKKKLILGVALGLFLGLGIWFVAAFAEEMKRAGSDKKGEVTE